MQIITSKHENFPMSFLLDLSIFSRPHQYNICGTQVRKKVLNFRSWQIKFSTFLSISSLQYCKPLVSKDASPSSEIDVGLKYSQHANILP